ncbi:ABC transporter substrate-binding protein [Corynebacterium neomassiliense]|uniref:ABC transporter substrate-binding protein n=1 Tax=Corynebacterium neomassiliense TaxID=2079482 RepID=UPI001F1C49CF|nr:ABC transporter substrate-binding protein [Corynebacterium neomassiliense]
MTKVARRHGTVVGGVHALRGAAAVAVAVAAAAVTVSCGTDGEDGATTEEDFTYVLDSTPVTTNAASSTGVVTDAAKLSARLYPGAFIPGPGNRLLPNTDLVTATPEDGNPDAVDYVIADTATYSDGAPVVCDDFLLSWVAAHRTDLFASDPGLMTRVRDISCVAGEKKFRVDFDAGAGQRYRELFGPGEVLPSHTVASAAGVPDVVDAVNTGDPDALAALGRSWTSTFDLATTDPATVPTYGPFRIEAREGDGALLLSANPEWSGDRPGIDRIVVTGGGDLARAVNGTADVVDAAVRPGQPTDADLAAAGFTVDRTTGSRIDGLTLATDGVFATADNRRAFTRCIDRDAVVAAVATSTGAKVAPGTLRVAGPGSPAAEALTPPATADSSYDPAATRAVLGGVSVRVGFPADRPRYAAEVEAVTTSCAAAGVTVEAVQLPAAAFDLPGVLGRDVDAVLDTRTAYGRNPSVTASPVSTVSQIREAEQALAQEAATVPLSVEPRLTAVAGTVTDVSDSGTDTGLSWNMDRWISTDHPVTDSAAEGEEDA